VGCVPDVRDPRSCVAHPQWVGCGGVSACPVGSRRLAASGDAAGEGGRQDGVGG
jgi:hypothetical protein